MADERILTTKREARSLCLQVLAQGGYELVSDEDPHHALWGVKIRKLGEDGRPIYDSPNTRLLWPRFAAPLTPIRKQVSVAKLADLWREGAEGCDDQRLRKIGYCRHDLDKGLNFIFEVPLAKIQVRTDQDKCPDFYRIVATRATRSPSYAALSDAHTREVGELLRELAAIVRVAERAHFTV